MRGCRPGSLPPCEAASGWPLGRPVSRKSARLCVHVTHAARQARGGLGLASRPAHNALRWEDRCPGSPPPHDAAPGWPLGPALTLLERSGLGAAFRHAYIDSSLRSKAAAQAAHRRARRPRARLSAGPYTLLECKAVTTRLAKLSGLGSASRPAYSSLRREAAAQAAYRRARLGGSSLAPRPSYIARRDQGCCPCRQLCLPGIVPVCYMLDRLQPTVTDS